MSEGFDPKVKSEVIVISGLNNYKFKPSYSYYLNRLLQRKKKEENPNKSEKEIKEEVKEEIKRMAKKSKEESMQRYYKITNEKAKELESKIKETKSKINFDSENYPLRDGKFYKISKGYLFIYDNSSSKKLHEIKLENDNEYFSVVQMDNQDLILYSGEKIIIYRLIKDKFVLVQKINDNQAGFPTQRECRGCEPYPKPYLTKFIEGISGNRFIRVSNYGYKIYSLNEKNEYIITLLEDYNDELKTIIELDKNNFIFLSEMECIGNAGPSLNILFIDKIGLKEISKSEKAEKLKEVKEREKDVRYYDEADYFGDGDKKPDKTISEEEIKNVIESLKYTHKKQELLEYDTSFGTHHYFRGNVLLKNKYLIVSIDHNILIFDASSGKQLKRYEILLYGEDNLYKCKAIINKLNNFKDNEFILYLEGNIILFELINESDLKITSQIYFEDIKYLKKLFYINDSDDKIDDNDENDDLDKMFADLGI